MINSLIQLTQPNNMKRVLLISILILGFAFSIKANEKEDSLNYYFERLSVAWDSGDYLDACFSFDNTLRLYKELAVNVSQDTVYATIAGKYAELSYQFGDFDRAIELYKEVSDIYNSYGNKSYQYATSLSNLARCYDKIFNYEEAIKYEKFSRDIIKSVHGVNHMDYATSLNNLASHYAGLGDYKEAIRLCTEGITIRKKILGENHPDYASSLLGLSFYNLQVGNYDDAIQQSTVASEIYKATYGEENKDYILTLSILVRCHLKSGNYIEALRLAEKVMETRKRIFGESHPDYAASLGEISAIYSKLGMYKEAIRLAKEAMEIRKKKYGEDDPIYAAEISSLAHYYSEIGNYSEAIRLETAAMVIRKKVFGELHPNYISCLTDLSCDYRAIGNYSDALFLGAKAVELGKKVLGEEHPDYATILLNLAAVYSELGNYFVAIQLEREAMEIQKKSIGQEHPEYATTLNNLALDYSEVDDYNESIRLGKEALKIRKTVFGEDHPSYIQSLNNLALFYCYLQDYNKAKELETKAEECSKKSLGQNHPNYASCLYNLANIHSIIGDYDKAIKLGKEAMDVCKKAFGNEHPYYAKSLYCLADYYSDLGKYNEVLPFLKEYVSIVRKSVLSTFGGLSTNERTLYWDKYAFDFNSWIPQTLVKSGITETSSILYDNAALFGKGLLLSTELEITKIIQEKGDTKALQLYTELQQNRQVLNTQYSKPLAERSIDCDSLEKASSNLERQLVSRVKEFGDYTKNLSITWQDVQSKLNDKDIAIEFISYHDTDKNTSYVALTLCKNDTTPILTPLFANQELLGVSGEDGTYHTLAADSLIWGPLSSCLEDKSHVYFSASGLLHNIGIEYLPSMEGKKCYRLSSTRELVTHQQSPAISSATLYGDIDYDATYASIESSTPASIRDYAMNTVTNQYRGVFDYRSLQYGVTSLPGARIELEDVSSLMEEHKTQYEAMTGVQASEESFKALSGRRKSLLHISTHGFYYNQEDADKFNDRIRMMLMGTDRPANPEDQSLLRCGLCLAGANQTLTGKGQPSERQGDGILNALEIAQTDLRGLDLVVLSACQTALGDLKGSEGVFGLQRGFKKAGAKSILMSLWKVNDLTTQLLMTEFYKHYLSGQSKLESLMKAQEFVRNYEDKDGNKLFEDPYYWAGFILLDALD